MNRNYERKTKILFTTGIYFFEQYTHSVHTVLGSRISVCLWDEKTHIGGMNQFIYAEPSANQRTALFGSISVPFLIKMLIEMGAVKSNLRAHIIGEANCSTSERYKIGEKTLQWPQKFSKIIL